MNIESNIPHFNYQLSSIHHPHFQCIEVDGEVIHHIQDLDAFYAVFGYTPAMKQSYVSPEEFIWAEYVNDSNIQHANCMQMRIMEYLNKYSVAFREKYGAQYGRLLAAHAEEIAARGVTCIVCRMRHHSE